MSMPKICFSIFAVLFFLLAKVGSVGAFSSQYNCGLNSTFALAQLLQVPVSLEQEKGLASAYPDSTVSLSNLKSMTASLGLKLNGVKAQLSDLVKQQHPSIIHLNNPEHFTVLLDGSSDTVRIMDSRETGIQVVPRKVVEDRFDGYALMLSSSDHSNSHQVYPQARFENTDYWAAVVGVGQQVEGSFVLSNVGRSNLTVNIKSTSCGCTGATFENGAKDIVLKPGFKSQLRAQVDVTHVGNFQQFVTLETNDPLRPLIYLTVRGLVPQNLWVSVDSLSLNSDKGQAIRKQVQVAGPLKMNILAATVDKPYLKASLESAVEQDAKKTWRIQVASTTHAPVGESKATLTIKTTNAERPVVTIPIDVRVQGDIGVNAQSGFFGFVSVGQPQQRQVAVKSRTKTPFRIRSARLSGVKFADGEVKVLNTSVSSADHSIVLKLSASQVAFIDGSLELLTDVKGEERIVIPVTAFVQDDTVNPKAEDGRADDASNSLNVVVPDVKELSFGDINKPVRKSFVVEGPQGKPFSITSIRSESTEVVGKANPDVVATAHAVEVNLTPRADSKELLEDKLILTLSNGQTLYVPVKGTITKPLASETSLKVNEPASGFDVVDMNGNPQNLNERRGKKNLLLTFFPKCFTGGCTNHLSTLRDEYSKFVANDTDVLAVSVDAADGEQGQLAFAAKWGFQFPLIPDVSRKLSMLYGAAQIPTDLSSRMTVLIDKDGIIRWVDRDVNVTTHGADVLKKMRELGMVK